MPVQESYGWGEYPKFDLNQARVEAFTYCKENGFTVEQFNVVWMMFLKGAGIRREQ